MKLTMLKVRFIQHLGMYIVILAFIFGLTAYLYYHNHSSADTGTIPSSNNFTESDRFTLNHVCTSNPVFPSTVPSGICRQIGVVTQGVKSPTSTTYCLSQSANAGTNEGGDSKSVTLLPTRLNHIAYAAEQTCNGITYSITNNGVIGPNYVPIYKQLDYWWVPYPNPSGNICGSDNTQPCTIGTSGCGIVAAAMVLSYYHKAITISDLAAYAINNHYRYDGGTKGGFFEGIATHLQLSEKTLNDWDAIKQDLIINKRPIIVSGIGAAPFTLRGHYVVLTGYHDGVVTLNDSAGGDERDFRDYPESVVRKGFESGSNRAYLIYQ